MRTSKAPSNSLALTRCQMSRVLLAPQLRCQHESKAHHLWCIPAPGLKLQMSENPRAICRTAITMWVISSEMSLLITPPASYLDSAIPVLRLAPIERCREATFDISAPNHVLRGKVGYCMRTCNLHSSTSIFAISLPTRRQFLLK